MKTLLGPPTSRNLHQYSGESVKRQFELENDNASASGRQKERVEIPKFEELKAKAKFLKLGIEKDLSAMYNGRPVFVQGSFE